VFIQTEETPNPETLKFIPGRVVMIEGTASYGKGDACTNSIFAQRLLEIEGVEGVFLGADFISITKNADKDWYLLKPLILGIIMEHFVAGLPVISENSSAKVSHYDDNDPLIKQIIELLDTRVRPAVAQDGGDITFHSFENGIVYLTLQGACSGCPSSTATLKSGIENMLKYYIPEIMEVRATG
jgi:Fe-S cluster biogenesis protein NfuA